jgi:hypothetical protein
MSLTKEHYNVFSAIRMWISTLIELCDENYFDSHTNEYHSFIVNAPNVYDNPNRETYIKQGIEDFYNYFYINQHICDINCMRTFGELDNNYGIGEYKLRLLDVLKKIESNAQSKSVFQKITIYVFHLCCFERDKLGLTIFDDTKKDTSIVKCFTRHP